MTDNKFISVRLIDGKPRKVIVDKSGNVVNRSPTEGELKGIKKELYKKRYHIDNEYLLGFMRQFYKENGRIPKTRDFINNPEYPSYAVYERIFDGWNNAIKDAGLWSKRYNDTNTFDRCGESFEELDILGKFPHKECDEQRNWTGRWDCKKCWDKYDPNSGHNIIKSIANCRTKKQNPNHSNTKGDNIQKLVCILYGWEDLNKKYDNYTTPIDFIDKNGLLHQVQGRRYNSRYKWWNFGDFEGEWDKDYEDIILVCKNKDGKIIEEIYRIPVKKEIKKKRKNITIVKYPSRGIPWYEKYRIKEPEELIKANEIWKKILDEQ